MKRSRNGRNSFFTAYLVFSACTISSCVSSAPKRFTHAPGEALYRDANTGLEVYDDLSSDPFPEDWHSDEHAVAATPIDDADIGRSMSALKSALSKYPPSVIRSNLKHIYLLGSLEFDNISAAATSSSDSLYISVSSNDPQFDEGFIENCFHHEFSHLLQNKFAPDWPTKAWTNCNSIGFHYSVGSGVESIRSGRISTVATDEWNVKGFSSEYGASDPYEDFATISANLFSGDETFWARVDRFPALKSKVTVAEQFYNNLDHHFTNSYFRKLHSEVPVQN